MTAPRFSSKPLCRYCCGPIPEEGWVRDTAGGVWCSDGCHDEDEAERLRAWHEPMTVADPLGMDDDGPWDATGRL